MTSKEKKEYIDEVISWMENGLSKEESSLKLRENGLGLVSADTIVITSFNKLKKAYINEVVFILKNDTSKDFETVLKENVPNLFVNEISPTIKERILFSIRQDVISELNIEKPIKEIINRYESNVVSRNQIKRWIISYYDNLVIRERKLNKTIMMSGMISIVFGVIFMLTLWFSSTVFISKGLIASAIIWFLSGIITFLFGMFKQTSDYPKM